MRFDAVTSMAKAYRPSLPLDFLTTTLAFDYDPKAEKGNGSDKDNLAEGQKHCEEWLKSHGAVLITDNRGEIVFDTKVVFSFLLV